MYEISYLFVFSTVLFFFLLEEKETQSDVRADHDAVKTYDLMAKQ